MNLLLLPKSTALYSALKKEHLIEVTKDNTVFVAKKGMELADLDAVDLSSTPSTNEE
jgi:hypothetical protein